MQARIATAEALVGFLQGYLAIGLTFAVLFALFGVSRVDPGARFDRTAPLGSALFRLLVIPATTLLWPVVLVRSIVILRRRRSGEGEGPVASGEATGGPS